MSLSLILPCLGLAAVGVCWAYSQEQKREKRNREVFQSLSLEIMERNQRQFLELAQSVFAGTEKKIQESVQTEAAFQKKSFEGMMQPLQEAMKQFDFHQRELEKRREGAYASLSQQIEQMMRAEGELRREASQLSHALRSPPVRGAWGQIHLRRVVEIAGLLNQCDFDEQASVVSNGKVFRPDLVVRLPGEKCLVVDAKAPLSAYIEAGEEVDDGVRQQKWEAHAAQLRKHIRDLSQKEYWKRMQLTPEFVVLFLPAESFFSAALQVDPSLIENGAAQNIIVATPTTLIAILRAVAQCWKQDALSKNAEQIALLGQELYDRLNLLSEYWAKVGKSLTGAVDAYNQTVASLETRVLVSARKLQEHGAGVLQKEMVPLVSLDASVRSLNSCK